MKKTFGAVAALLLSTGLACGSASAETKPFAWTGFYAGAHGGMDITEVSFGGPIGLAESAIGYGLSIGFDYQMPGVPIVVGIAADHTWTDAAAVDKHWSITGRAGVTLGHVMPYALAGYKRADALGTSIDGWVAGGGIEIGLTQALFVGGEYRFTSYDLPSGVPAGIDAEAHEVRATLKYKFSPF